MKTILSGLVTYYKGRFEKCNISIVDGIVADVFAFPSSNSGDTVYEFNNCYCFPGFIDVHVHLREPGFSYKETIETGSRAAAYGGYTTVCTMPNLNPVPDSLENLKLQLDKIKESAAINVIPFGSITKGEMGRELSDFEDMAQFTAGYSDDGKGIQSEEMMESAMLRARAIGKIISAHCEDNSLLFGGCIHDGEFAEKNGFKGISSESEYKQIERDLRLAEKTGCKYHVCHISTKESVALIRDAKKRGVDVTCETGPHYLVLTDMDLKDEGRFKMNPPLRSEADRKALIEGICDGTIDMIATDHAPHSAEEKSRGLEKSLMGITGIETAFPILYTNLVKTGVITLEKLMELLVVNPARRFGIGGEIEIGKKAELTIFDLDEKFTIEAQSLKSMGKSTPFDKVEVQGKHKMTVFGEKIYK